MPAHESGHSWTSVLPVGLPTDSVRPMSLYRRSEGSRHDRHVVDFVRGAFDGVLAISSSHISSDELGAIPSRTAHNGLVGGSSPSGPTTHCSANRRFQVSDEKPAICGRFGGSNTARAVSAANEGRPNNPPGARTVALRLPTNSSPFCDNLIAKFGTS
jgi:hypothetical protein